ncbi:MAG: DegT/DnrJ/EryC1/StrS family aminotransferase [Oscillospiraceae bacterium]|nr:DegT/DnrJ/EryC1/StrS family aminotransferase [Oscillospiraceae bacterium]
MEKKIYLSSPYLCGKEMEFVQQAISDNWIAPLGPSVDGFEREMCEYTGAQYAVAMSSGTAAVHMALRYLGVEKDDTVFCSSLTFAASCNPVIYEGGTPVFIDSEPSSWNMSPIALEKAFEKYPNPKAVIVVNLYGQSTDLDKIMEICNKYNTPIIEDAAESLGATYRGRMSGTIGRFGVYSFNGNKIITTSGGGMLICPDEESKNKVTKWITQSRDPARYYQHSELGFNYRMSNICACFGRGQLTAIGDRIRKKHKIYDTYKEAFADIDEIEMMPIRDYGVPNWWLSCVTIKENNKITPTDIIISLENENIESRPIWKPMHLQPYYEGYDYFTHKTDISSDIFTRGLCLPSDVSMNEEDINRVINIVRRHFI